MLIVSRRCDDCIRQALAEAKHKKMVESEKVRERGHVQGMAVAKKAMEGALVRSTVLRMLVLHTRVSQTSTASQARYGSLTDCAVLDPVERT